MGRPYFVADGECCAGCGGVGSVFYGSGRSDGCAQEESAPCSTCRGTGHDTGRARYGLAPIGGLDPDAAIEKAVLDMERFIDKISRSRIEKT